MKIKLGTRRSLLAWAQSSWVAREVERLNPGVQVELVGIETRGDKIQNVPLQQVEGKDFFVKELDEALAGNQVDFCVHSMKDLSLDRPAEFVMAAVPPRANPRDVVLFGPKILEKIREGQTIVVGTSSPRRLENIPGLLRELLPRFSPEATPKLKFVDIRGNVNTRLSRVHEPSGSEKYLDGVVLAMAGLSRLFADEKARIELERLFAGTRIMVLPLRENPTAPAQGALAVECRKSDENTRLLLAKLHDPKTAQAVARERDVLSEFGGGCHQRFGATVIGHSEFDTALIARGVSMQGAQIERFEWQGHAKADAGPVWDGRVERASSEVGEVKLNLQDVKGNAVFVSVERALPKNLKPEDFAAKKIWTSGTGSWKKLATRGFWVVGCAEELGFEWIEPTILDAVVGGRQEITVLTHEQARSEWPVKKGLNVVGTYSVTEANYESDSIERLNAAKHVYWGAASQFDALHQHAKNAKTHACGAGKTATVLARKIGSNLKVFPSYQDWKRWVENE